jgi:CBS domain containing-hemolysin-like protein
MESHHYSLVEIGFRLFAALFLVLLNGFFVAAEFAIVKVRSTQIETLVKRHHMGPVPTVLAQHLAPLSATYPYHLVLGPLAGRTACSSVARTAGFAGIESQQVVSPIALGVASPSSLSSISSWGN